MPTPSPEALAAAVNALYRIRAVEMPAPGDGTKTVWHQCALGADLLSTVNGRGEVTKQELTLLNVHVQWTFEKGIVTGTATETSRHGGGDASMDVAYDGEIDARKIATALNALATYAGDDRYLMHVVQVLRRANEGEATLAASQVTAGLGAQQPPEFALNAPPQAAPARPSRWRWWVAAAGILGVLAGAVALLSR